MSETPILMTTCGEPGCESDEFTGVGEVLVEKSIAVTNPGCWRCRGTGLVVATETDCPQFLVHRRMV